MKNSVLGCRGDEVKNGNTEHVLQSCFECSTSKSSGKPSRFAVVKFKTHVKKFLGRRRKKLKWEGKTKGTERENTRGAKQCGRRGEERRRKKVTGGEEGKRRTVERVSKVRRGEERKESTQLEFGKETERQTRQQNLQSACIDSDLARPKIMNKMISRWFTSISRKSINGIK